MAYCTNCGNLLDENAKFCANCGKKIIVGEQSEQERTIDIAVNNVKEEKRLNIPWGTGIFLIIILFVLLFWKKGPNGTYFDASDGDTYVFKSGYLSYGSIYAGWTEGGEPYKYSFGTIYGTDSYGNDYEMASYSFILDEVQMGGTTLKKYK